MATHSSILAWEPHGQGSLVGYSPLGLYRVGHDWSNLAHTPSGWAFLIAECVAQLFTLPWIHTVYISPSCDCVRSCVTWGLTVVCIRLCSWAPALTGLGWLTGLGEGIRHLQQLTPWARLCDPRDCSPPGSSVHGVLQARVLGRVAMPSSRGSSRPRDQTQVSHIVGRCFTVWATREVPLGPRGPQGERNAILRHWILRPFTEQPFGGTG